MGEDLACESQALFSPNLSSLFNPILHRPKDGAADG